MWAAGGAAETLAGASTTTAVEVELRQEVSQLKQDIAQQKRAGKHHREEADRAKRKVDKLLSIEQKLLAEIQLFVEHRGDAAAGSTLEHLLTRAAAEYSKQGCNDQEADAAFASGLAALPQWDAHADVPQPAPRARTSTSSSSGAVDIRLSYSDMYVLVPPREAAAGQGPQQQPGEARAGQRPPQQAGQAAAAHLEPVPPQRAVAGQKTPQRQQQQQQPDQLAAALQAGEPGAAGGACDTSVDGAAGVPLPQAAAPLQQQPDQPAAVPAAAAVAPAGGREGIGADVQPGAALPPHPAAVPPAAGPALPGAGGMGIGDAANAPPPAVAARLPLQPVQPAAAQPGPARYAATLAYWSSRDTDDFVATFIRHGLAAGKGIRADVDTRWKAIFLPTLQHLSTARLPDTAWMTDKYGHDGFKTGWCKFLQLTANYDNNINWLPRGALPRGRNGPVLVALVAEAEAVAAAVPS